VLVRGVPEGVRLACLRLGDPVQALWLRVRHPGQYRAGQLVSPPGDGAGEGERFGDVVAGDLGELGRGQVLQVAGEQAVYPVLPGRLICRGARAWPRYASDRPGARTPRSPGRTAKGPAPAVLVGSQVIHRGHGLA